MCLRSMTHRERAALIGRQLVTGGIEIVGHASRAEEVSDEHCTLCRCGSSKNKPFCDGTHWHIGFRDEKN